MALYKYVNYYYYYYYTLSSELIQMCVTLLGQRHLVNAYEMNAGWLVPFVDKRVGGG